MKIELEYPFNQTWRKGYLVMNKEPRRNVILFNSDKDRTTISYARYLMSVHLGRFLNANEHVDHIDNNRLNDCVENFQLLSPADNNAKSTKAKTFFSFTCPVCKKQFKLESRQSHRQHPTCSRKCGGIKSHWA